MSIAPHKKLQLPESLCHHETFGSLTVNIRAKVYSRRLKLSNVCHKSVVSSLHGTLSYTFMVFVSSVKCTCMLLGTRTATKLRHMSLSYIGSAGDLSDITLAVRPGGTSLGSCGSTNVPLKYGTAGVLAWAHVDELAEEVADLRRRLCEEEEVARKLADEV